MAHPPLLSQAQQQGAGLEVELLDMNQQPHKEQLNLLYHYAIFGKKYELIVQPKHTAEALLS